LARLRPPLNLIAKSGRILLLSALCFCYSCAHHAGSRVPAPAEKANSVAVFLNNAERQAETDEQRRDIQRALRDMLDKPPAELRQLRYPDYAGKANTWSITQFLQRYFVPSPPAVLDEEGFYKDIHTETARAAIQRQLDAVTRALQ
jgi:hypothetical protein